MKSDKTIYETYRILITVIISLLLCVIQAKAQTNTGKYWAKAADSTAFSARSSHQIISFNGKLWLIGGNSKGKLLKDVWNSEDAINWKLVTDNCGFEGGTAVVFHEKIWVINSNDKGVWNSTDGQHWQKVSSIFNAAMFATRAIVFKDKIWLTGGADVLNAYLPDGKLNPDRKVIWSNDVWSSSDGITWKKEDISACFSNRSDHSMAVFNNKIWVLCGQSGRNKNDVWCSDNGIDWTKVTDAPFAPRHVTQAVAFDNKLWVIAGFAMDSINRPITLSDLWSSSDGRNWENVTSSASFGERQEHQAVVFKNKLWVIGGYKNDIWYTESSSVNTKSSVKQGNYLRSTLKWSKKNNLIENIVLETVTIKNKIYCLKMNGEVCIYHPDQGSLIKIAEIPVHKTAFGAAAMQNKIYIIGGITGVDSNGKDIRSNTVEIFDPSNESWSVTSNLSTGVHFPASAVYNEKLYVISGKYNSDIQNVVQEYDPSTNKWTKKTDSPPAAFYWGSAVINNKIYAIDEKGQVAVYSFSSDKWEIKRSLMTARSEFGTVVINDKIFVLGGWTSNGKYVSDLVEMYNPIEDNWSSAGNMPIPKYFIHPAVVDNKVYIIGGMIRGWGSESGSLECNSVEFFEIESFSQNTASGTK